MIYDILTKLLRKNFYILSSERFKNSVSKRILERWAGKHRLLTPELIIVNDQPYGFKKLSRRLKNLEKFPIYCEIEYVEEDENEAESRLIESVDLFSEITLTLHNKVSTLNRLCDLFSGAVVVERVKRIGVPNQSSLLIYSRLGETFLERFFEEELEEGSTSEIEIQNILSKQISDFTNFIKIFDEVLLKGKKIDAIDPALLP